MVALEEISGILEHPLTLLLIGAGITSLLIPWFTKRSEDRKKELEIKVDIVSKMAEVMGYLIGESITLPKGTKDTLTDADEKAHFERIKKLYVDSRIVTSKLKSYFSEKDIIERWDGYIGILASYGTAAFAYTLKDPTNAAWEGSLRYNLGVLRTSFSDNKEIDWNRLTTEMIFDRDLWLKVNDSVENRGNEIIAHVLRLQPKLF
jgi:hypothetical protein